MTPYFIDKLPEYGLTNLIEIDGLLYAPVSDLWEFFVDYNVDQLATCAVALVSVVVILWACEKLADYIVVLVRYLKNKNT